jgi:hypothetical protein
MSTRVLAVADWAIDPRLVAEALEVESDHEPTVFGLLVPSRLFGLDWIGDPYASCRCAGRQLGELERLMQMRGMTVESARVGDPERVSAIHATLEAWPADRIVLFDRDRLLPRHALSVARRVERSTGRAVERVAVPAAPATPRGFLRRVPRCATA